VLRSTEFFFFSTPPIDVNRVDVDTTQERAYSTMTLATSAAISMISLFGYGS
jgi:hypothetical protein